MGEFSDRYGPWAVVAGASDGVGEALARGIAARGVNVVLLARRRGLLDQVAAAIRSDYDVEARPVVVDLATDRAGKAVIDATVDLEVGLVVYCAGADPDYRRFLTAPVNPALAMVHRNCVVPMELCHHFAVAMQERGRGGIVLVGSGAGLVGAPNMVAYAATKAFGLVMAESLWAELHDHGVDVLGAILALTDTPALRRLLARRGVLAEEDDAAPIPGAIGAAAAAEECLDHLADGPTWFVGEMMREGARHLASLPRNDAVRLMIEVGGGVLGPDR